MNPKDIFKPALTLLAITMILCIIGGILLWSPYYTAGLYCILASLIALTITIWNVLHILFKYSKK